MNRQIRKLANLSSAVGDGKINPNEIASIGTELFGDALDIMGYSNEAAMEAAELQTDYYSTAYADVTAEQYYNNPALGAQASLYFDEAGELNTDMMYQEFYEEALEEYANTVIMPKLKELEADMENERTEIESELEHQEAELQTVKDNISESIQNTTIKL